MKHRHSWVEIHREWDSDDCIHHITERCSTCGMTQGVVK